MAKKRFKCSKCDRTFSMAAHLARHMSTHASSKKKAAARRSRQAKKVWKARKAKKKTVGRPKGATARLGLRNMSLEQLSDLLTAVRVEMRRQLAEIRKAVQ